MRLLAVSKKSNKTNSEKKNSLFFFFYIRLQKQYNSLMYWLLMYCGQKMIIIHANSPGLYVSLPNTAPISRSPVRVTISPE